MRDTLQLLIEGSGWDPWFRKKMAVMMFWGREPGRLEHRWNTFFLNIPSYSVWKVHQVITWTFEKATRSYKQFCVNIVLTLRPMDRIISKPSSLFQLCFCLKHYHQVRYFHRFTGFINVFQHSGWKVNKPPGWWGCFKWVRGKQMKAYVNSVELGVTDST